MATETSSGYISKLAVMPTNLIETVRLYIRNSFSIDLQLKDKLLIPYIILIN